MSDSPWRVVVAPHPDDEGQALAALEDHASLAAVVVLTRGEATTRRLAAEAHPADGLEHSLREQLRSTAGSPLGFDRLASWWVFLDAALGSIPDTFFEVAGGVAWFGQSPARFVFTAADRSLRVDTIVAAVAVVLGELATERPLELVLCAFEGANYHHPDHAALGAAAPALAALPGIERVLVRRTAGSVVLSASAEFYERQMGAGGAFQKAYGWLAPNRHAWDIDEPPADGLFPQASAFAPTLGGRA